MDRFVIGAASSYYVLHTYIHTPAAAGAAACYLSSMGAAAGAGGRANEVY